MESMVREESLEVVTCKVCAKLSSWGLSFCFLTPSQAEAEKKTSWTRTRSYIVSQRASEQGEQTGVGV